MLRQKPGSVDILILGAGWTSTFLIPQLDAESIVHAETTTTGRNDTIPFKFDPSSTDVEPYKRLPSAKTVLLTFPLVGKGQSESITSLYRQIHGDDNNWIQLGSTGIFNKCADWSNDNSPYDRSNNRAVAEDELRECVCGCILNLSGLYGGQRKPKTWMPRIAKSKGDIAGRTSVHFIHGEDVAKAIIATHKKFTPGRRWIIADLRVYDWWDLIMSFSALADEEENESPEEAEKKLEWARWVGELMLEEDVKALPRPMEMLGRKLDSRGFWSFHGLWPRHARLA